MMKKQATAADYFSRTKNWGYVQRGKYKNHHKQTMANDNYIFYLTILH